MTDQTNPSEAEVEQPDPLLAHVTPEDVTVGEEPERSALAALHARMTQLAPPIPAEWNTMLEIIYVPLVHDIPAQAPLGPHIKIVDGDANGTFWLISSAGQDSDTEDADIDDGHGNADIWSADRAIDKVLQLRKDARRAAGL